MIREIANINENLCDGCGLCIPGCHENALQIIDGKARLVSELMCDGLGDCLGSCPQNAITIEKREAEEYDEYEVIKQMIPKGKATVFAHLKHLHEHQETEYLKQALGFIKANQEKIPFTLKEVHEMLRKEDNLQDSQIKIHLGCPGTTNKTFNLTGLKIESKKEKENSALTHWPIQLHLINPAATYFKNSDLLVAADCTAFAYNDFQRKFLEGKKVVISCPKLDQGKEIYIRKLNQLIKEAKIKSITVVIMEVPCCGGLTSIISTSLLHANSNLPFKLAVISTTGELLSEKCLN